MTSLKKRNITLTDPVAILNRDLLEGHSGMKSSTTFPTTATRTFNISLQFDSPSDPSKITIDVGGGGGHKNNSNNNTNNSKKGIPCRFRSVIELGAVEHLASAPIENWRHSQSKTTWTAEEDLAIIKAASALVAWESYRGARSAFPGSLEDADAAFPKPAETDEDKELFAERWHALNEAENFERKRLLSFLQQSRAFADDTQVKNDDDLLDRIRLQTGANNNNNNSNDNHAAAALTSVPNQKSSALHKAVTRKIRQIRSAINNSSDGEPIDSNGMHSHAPPNKTLVGAMSPDMVVVAKSAPTSMLHIKMLQQEYQQQQQKMTKMMKKNNNALAASAGEQDASETEDANNNNNNVNDPESSSNKTAVDEKQELGAEVSTIKCSSTSVLPASNFLKQLVALNVANQKSLEAALRSKRLREKEEREATAEIESIKTGTPYEEIVAALEREVLQEEGITIEELRAQEGVTSENDAYGQQQQQDQIIQQHDGGVDLLPGSTTTTTDPNHQQQQQQQQHHKPKYPPVTLSEYDDQFGLTPGKDSFGVFSKQNLERFFNFCEDLNAVDLCNEAEQEYIAVRDAVERYSIRSGEAKLLHQRRSALKSLETSQEQAEAELRNSFQKTFDDVVSSLANVFESHMTTAVQALRDKVEEEKERIDSMYDMEEHALMLARYKLGLAAYCPDSVANRKSFHQLEGRRGMLLGDYQKWGTSPKASEALASAFKNTSSPTKSSSSGNASADLYSSSSSNQRIGGQSSIDDPSSTNNNTKETLEEDPLEIITHLLLLTEALQCPQLSQTLVQEIATSSHHFVEFYNRKEFHEFPLLSRETMKGLLTAVPLSELIQAKEIEGNARQEEAQRLEADADADFKSRVEAANKARSNIPVERHPPPPPPPQSVFSQLADEEMAARRRSRREQLEQMSTAELRDLLKRCKVTASRLRRKFREQIRKQKQQVFQQQQKNSSSSTRRQSRVGGGATASRFQQQAASAVSSISSHQQETMLPAIMSIKRKDVINLLLEDDDDQEYDDEILNGIELAKDVNAGQIEKLGEELTTDSGEEDEEKAVDVLVSRLLNSSSSSSHSREGDNSKVRVAITQNINKMKIKRKKHVEDATHFIELIEEVLSRRLFSTKGALLATADAASEGISASTISAVNEQNQKMIAASMGNANNGNTGSLLPSAGLKSSSLLLLTSSFKRGNRWRIHNKVSAHDTAVAVNERGNSTVLTALRPLKTFTYFAMFPNEATLRRRCGTTTGKVFFQVRVLNGPGPANQTRLIGVGFDTSAHSRKVPMLNHDPLDPPVYRRDPKSGAMVVVNKNNNNNNSSDKKKGKGKYNQQQYDITGKEIHDTIGPFKSRWGLTSTNEDMCMSILNKLANKNKKTGNTMRSSPNRIYNNSNMMNDSAAAAAAAAVEDPSFKLVLFDENAASNNNNNQEDDGSNNGNNAKFMSDTSFVPGSTPAPHPTESSLASELRRSAITSRKRANRGGLEPTAEDFENLNSSSNNKNDFFDDPLSSPFDTYEDESRVVPDRADHGFLWLSNGTIMLHGATYSLGRDGTFVVGDTLHIALNEAEGTVLLFRNGHQVASPLFVPCPPVELLTQQTKTGGLGTRSSITNLFNPQLPQRHDAKPVLERSFWGVGPLIPCVTLLDSAPEHTVEGRAGKIGYLQSDLFSIQHKTFRKANMGSVDGHLVEDDAGPKATTSADATKTTGSSSSSSATPPPPPAVAVAAASPTPTATTAIVDANNGVPSDLDLNRFSLPSVECNVEGPFEEDQIPEFLMENNYVPFLKAQRDL